MAEIDENARKGGTLNSLALYVPKIKGPNEKKLGQVVNFYLSFRQSADRIGIERTYDPDDGLVFFTLLMHGKSIYISIYDNPDPGEDFIVSLFGEDKKHMQGAFGNWKFVRKWLINYLGI